MEFDHVIAEHLELKRRNEARPPPTRGEVVAELAESDLRESTERPAGSSQEDALWGRARDFDWGE